MRNYAFISIIISLLLVICSQVYGQGEQSTKVVVLGVGHTTQLVNRQQQPAVLRSYIEKVGPAAMAIELFPEEYVRNDFYEYTYEQQYVAVPYAIEHHIPVYPFDWKPSDEDLMLAFGTAEMEVGPFTRNPEGFQGFVNFKDTSDWKAPFYFAEDSSYKHKIANWYRHYPENPAFDFARRLYLYRTYLQAKRIEKIAANHRGSTVLVIVGYFHKEDIERVLSGNKRIEVLQSDVYGEITAEEIRKNMHRQDLYAIATFNLLGTQSSRGFDVAWLTEVVDEIAMSDEVEGELFRIRLGVLTKQIRPKEAIARYKQLLGQVEEKRRFTWTGVKYPQRLDSYIDPFGNMSIRQRLQVELAREHYKAGAGKEAERYKAGLEREFQGLKLRMLQEYWHDYVYKQI